MRVLEKSWKFVSEKGYKPCNGKTSICGQFIFVNETYNEYDCTFGNHRKDKVTRPSGVQFKE